MVGVYLFAVSWFFQPQLSLALSHDAPEASFTTALLGKHAVWVRRVLFSTVICVIGCLLVGSALVIHVKRQGEFEITLGALTIKRTGIYWEGTLWCPKRMEKPNAEPTLQSPLANAPDRGGLELETLANAHERRGRELERMELEASPEEDSARAPPVSASEKLEMMRKFEAEQVAKHKSAMSQRRWLLTSLFFIYCGVSMGLPLVMAGTVSCSNGYFWETHTYFVGVFGLTKIVELHLYATDESIAGGLDLVTFMFKFTTSFLGYVDAYTDATAIVIAHSCPDPLAQALSKCMLVSYIVGVLVAQWVVVASFAFQDPSHACIMKVLHMDALSACVSLPDDMKDTWNSLHMARTFGEDLPQAVLQSIYILKVKRNYFMMASICVGLGSSCKALIDAYSRRLEAAGLYERLEQAEEQAAESLIGTLQENRDLHDEIGDAESGDLIHLLRDKGGPKPITLSGRTLGKDAVTFLVSVVKMRRKIETLDLSNCNISDEGARTLSKALKEDDTLQNIILSSNPIGETGARSLSEELKEDDTLREIILSSDQIGETGTTGEANAVQPPSEPAPRSREVKPELKVDQVQHRGIRGLWRSREKALPKDRAACIEALNRCLPGEVVKLFKSLDEVFQEDITVVLAALKRCAVHVVPELYKLLPEELKDNEDVAMEAVERNPMALQYCSETLRNGKVMAMKALEFCPSNQMAQLLELCNKELHGNEFLKSVKTVHHNGLDLNYVREPMRSDKGVVMEAVKQNGEALKYCRPKLQDDRDVAMQAVKQNGESLQFCSMELRSDRDLVMEAARNTATALKFAMRGLSQDVDCLKAAGLLQVYREDTPLRPERCVLSVKFGFSSCASSLSTVFAIEMAKNSFMKDFRVHNPNLYCHKSCDPNYTDLAWPCRGTASTCAKQNTNGGELPTLRSCWRYSHRYQERRCQETGGFMLQIEERGRLGPGQCIETEMAAELGLKTFRYKWNFDDEVLMRENVKTCIVNHVADAVLDWFEQGKSDMKMQIIEADPMYDSKRFGGGW